MLSAGSVEIMLHFTELTFIPYFRHEALSSLVDIHSLLNTAETSVVSSAYLISVDRF